MELIRCPEASWSHLTLTFDPHRFISPILHSLPSTSKVRVGDGEELLSDQYYNRVFPRPGLCELGPKQSSYVGEKQVAPVLLPGLPRSLQTGSFVGSNLL